MDSRFLLVLVFAVASTWAVESIDNSDDVDNIERGFEVVKPGLFNRPGLDKATLAKIEDLLVGYKGRSVEDEERGFRDTMKKIGQGIKAGAKKAAPYAKKLLPVLVDTLRTREEIEEDEERGFAVVRPNRFPTVINRPGIGLPTLINRPGIRLPTLINRPGIGLPTLFNRPGIGLHKLEGRSVEDEERGFRDTMKKIGQGIKAGAKKAAPYAKKLLPVLVDTLRTREEETSDEIEED